MKAKKLLTLALAASMVIGTVTLPAAAKEDTTNLLAAKDPGFEQTGDRTGLISANYMTPMHDGAGAEGTEGYLAPKSDTRGIVSFAAPVEENEIYTVSFWTRTSLAGTANYDGPYFTITQSGFADEAPASALRDVRDTFFGRTHADGTTPWFKVSRSFFTAPGATNLDVVIFAGGSSTYDANMYIDNISLTKGTDNLIVNGGFESFKESECPMPWVNYRTAGTFPVDPTNPTGTNHVWRTTSANGHMIAQKITLKAGSYKLSMRYKASYPKYPAWNVPFAGISKGGDDWQTGLVFKRAMGEAADYDGDKDGWLTYSVYVTIDEDGEYQVGPGGDYFCDIPRLCDDLTLVPAETGVTFLDPRLAEITTKTKAMADDANKAGNAQNCWSEVNMISLRGNAIEKVTDVAASEEKYTITAAGHYVAKTNDEESFVMLTAVYKVFNETGMKLLSNVVITPGTTEKVSRAAANIHNSGNVLANITVPEIPDGANYTYEVSGMIWSDLGEMLPLGAATVLPMAK